jgi:hypothetical protein
MDILHLSKNSALRSELRIANTILSASSRWVVPLTRGNVSAAFHEASQG